MKSRSPLLILAVLGSCLTVLACASIFAVSAILLLTRAVPISALASTASNRVVFVGNDANIYVVDGAGANKIQLTKDGDNEQTKRYAFPTWAPNGQRIAFVGIDYLNSTPTRGTLYSTDPAAMTLKTLYSSDQSLPFYLYWSPDSRSISFLSSKDGSDFALDVANADGQGQAKEVQTGSPLFWAWSPDAKNLFLHVGGTPDESDSAQVALVPFGQSPHKLTASPGAFQTPSWSPDGRHLLFSEETDTNKQSVVLSDAQGSSAKSLFDYSGRVSLGWAPDGKHIAYVVTDPSINLPTFGQVHVMDADGKNDKVYGDHAVGFVWAPEGRHLAYLTFPAQGNSTSSRFKGLAQAGGNDPIKLEWDVIDLSSGKRHAIATFQPTDEFLNTLPVFDQYARSVTFWSPDSRHFVYSNAEAGGAGSIWSADATGSSSPVKIGDGIIGFWSWR